MNKAFTLIEVMIVVAMISILSGIAIPAFMQHRADARATSCANNLRLIDHAKRLVVTKFNIVAGGNIIAAEVDKYIAGGVAPICPDDFNYEYGTEGQSPVCTSTLVGHVLQ